MPKNIKYTDNQAIDAVGNQIKNAGGNIQIQFDSATNQFNLLAPVGDSIQSVSLSDTTLNVTSTSGVKSVNLASLRGETVTSANLAGTILNIVTSSGVKSVDLASLVSVPEVTQAELDSEVSARILGDTLLDNRIDVLEARPLPEVTQAELDAETAARIAGDTALEVTTNELMKRFNLFGGETTDIFVVPNPAGSLGIIPEDFGQLHRINLFGADFDAASLAVPVGSVIGFRTTADFPVTCTIRIPSQYPETFDGSLKSIQLKSQELLILRRSATGFDIVIRQRGNSPIVNNLTTTATGSVLDARQGKVLADMIAAAGSQGDVTLELTNYGRTLVLRKNGVDESSIDVSSLLNFDGYTLSASGEGDFYLLNGNGNGFQLSTDGGLPYLTNDFARLDMRSNNPATGGNGTISFNPQGLFCVNSIPVQLRGEYIYLKDRFTEQQRAISIDGGVLKIDGQPVVTSGGGTGGGDVTQAYVDAQDQGIRNDFSLLATNRANLVHPNQTRDYFASHEAALAVSQPGDTLVIPNSIVDMTATGNAAQIFLTPGISLQTEGFDIGNLTTEGDGITLVGGSGKVVGKNSRVFANSSGSWGIGSYGSADPQMVYEIYDLHIINSGGNGATFDGGKEIHFYNCHFTSSANVAGYLRRAVHVFFHDCIMEIGGTAAATYLGHSEAKFTFENCLLKVSGTRTNTTNFLGNRTDVGTIRLVSTSVLVENAATSAIRVNTLILEGNTVILGTVDAPNLTDLRPIPASTGGGGDVTKAYVDAADTYVIERVDQMEITFTEADDALGIRIDGKVDKVAGKQLSTEDFSTADKTKLDTLRNYSEGTGISIDASGVISATGGGGGGYDETPLKNRVSAVENGKVDKVAGKQLTDVNFSQVDKTKLDSLQNSTATSYSPTHFVNTLNFNSDILASAANNQLLVTLNDGSVEMSTLSDGLRDYLSNFTSIVDMNFSGTTLNLVTATQTYAVDLSSLVTPTSGPAGDTISTVTLTGNRYLNIITDKGTQTVDLQALKDGKGDTLQSFTFVGDVLTITTDGGSYPVNLASLRSTTGGGGTGGDTVTGVTLLGNSLTVNTNQGSFPVDLASLRIIPDGSIGNSKLAAGSITGDKLSLYTINGSHIADESLSNDNLGTSIVDSRVLGAGSVTAAKIGNLAVTNTKVADKAITAAKIADRTITNLQIAPQTVNWGEITDNAIRSNHILNSNVTLPKLGTDVQNSLNSKLTGSTLSTSGNNITLTTQTATGTTQNTITLQAGIIVPLVYSKDYSGVVDAALPSGSFTNVVSVTYTNNTANHIAVRVQAMTGAGKYGSFYASITRSSANRSIANNYDNARAEDYMNNVSLMTVDEIAAGATMTYTLQLKATDGNPRWRPNGSWISLENVGLANPGFVIAEPPAPGDPGGDDGDPTTRN